MLMLMSSSACWYTCHLASCMVHCISISVCLQGADAVSAYVTHGVFPKESWKRFTASGSSNGNGSPDFKYFWITDSCPRTVSAVQNQAPFEVLSLAEPIAAALQI